MNSKSSPNAILCQLCGSSETTFFFEDKFRPYRRCTVCFLIYVPSEFHVSAESEKARYEEHNNDADDAGYRNFLERITEPIKSRFAEGCRGLDFGCGPTPLLAAILKHDGYEMNVFDPFYAPNQSVLETKYDFIVTTEVVEHLSNPLSEFERLFSLIRDDGMLAVMTRPYNETVYFRGWHYKNDATHISFFSVETFEWMSKHLGEGFRQFDSDIFVFDRAENL